MPDPVDPTQPPPPPPPFTDPAAPTKSTTTGLPSNIAAALACIPLIGGIIFYILEKQDNFVRFYAMQSIIFGGAWFLASIILKVLTLVLLAIPVIGWFFVILIGIVWALGWIAFLVIFLITVIKACNGVRWEIPYIGPMAQKQMGGS
jgi:uncharacterized membrane protein